MSSVFCLLSALSLFNLLGIDMLEGAVGSFEVSSWHYIEISGRGGSGRFFGYDTRSSSANGFEPRSARERATGSVTCLPTS